MPPVVKPPAIMTVLPRVVALWKQTRMNPFGSLNVPPMRPRPSTKPVGPERPTPPIHPVGSEVPSPIHPVGPEVPSPIHPVGLEVPPHVRPIGPEVQPSDPMPPPMMGAEGEKLPPNWRMDESTISVSRRDELFSVPAHQHRLPGLWRSVLCPCANASCAVCATLLAVTRASLRSRRISLPCRNRCRCPSRYRCREKKST